MHSVQKYLIAVYLCRVALNECVQVVLIVNVATYWAFTHHYLGMNALQSNHQDFVVLGFPCNQFGMVSLPDSTTDIWCLQPSRVGIEHCNCYFMWLLILTEGV
jgi:hypothetical protein